MQLLLQLQILCYAISLPTLQLTVVSHNFIALLAQPFYLAIAILPGLFLLLPHFCQLGPRAARPPQPRPERPHRLHTEGVVDLGQIVQLELVGLAAEALADVVLHDALHVGQHVLEVLVQLRLAVLREVLVHQQVCHLRPPLLLLHHGGHAGA